MPATTPTLVTVTGPIAAGATTLAKQLASLQGWTPALEIDVESQNPFFPLYHADPHRYAFHNQVAFLTQSSEAHIRLQNSHSSIIVQDFSPYEHMEVYGFVQHEHSKLSEDEYSLLMRLHSVVSGVFVPPAVLVYRELSKEQLADRVHERGRPSEQGSDPAYLAAIQTRFESWVQQWNRCPVIRIPSGTDVLDANSNALREIGSKITSIIESRFR